LLPCRICRDSPVVVGSHLRLVDRLCHSQDAAVCRDPLHDDSAGLGENEETVWEERGKTSKLSAQNKMNGQFE
jgi:hypothetical protein